MNSWAVSTPRSPKQESVRFPSDRIFHKDVNPFVRQTAFLWVWLMMALIKSEIDCLRESERPALKFIGSQGHIFYVPGVPKKVTDLIKVSIKN